MTNRDQYDDDSNDEKREPPLCNYPGQADTSCGVCTCPAYREDASDPEGRCLNARPGTPWRLCGHLREQHHPPGC